MKKKKRLIKIQSKIFPGDNRISFDEKKMTKQTMRPEIPENEETNSKEQEEVENIPPKFKVSYSETCLFENSGDIILSIKGRNEILMSLYPLANHMHVVGNVLETGAGPKSLPRRLPRGKMAHRYPGWQPASFKESNEPKAQRCCDSKVTRPNR